MPLFKINRKCVILLKMALFELVEFLRNRSYDGVYIYSLLTECRLLRI
jgi:hypothetical protein